MKRVKQLMLPFVFVFFIFGKAHGQSISFHTNSFYGLWQNEGGGYFYGGGGFAVTYQHPLTKGALQAGLGFRTINWGNQVSLGIGYQAPYVRKEKWTLSAVTSVNLGLALFVNNPLLVYAIDYTPTLTWLRKKRFNFEAGLGIRYTHAPRYKSYGKINQVLEFPFQVGVIMKLGERKP